MASCLSVVFLPALCARTVSRVVSQRPKPFWGASLGEAFGALDAPLLGGGVGAVASGVSRMLGTFFLRESLVIPGAAVGWIGDTSRAVVNARSPALTACTSRS